MKRRLWDTVIQIGVFFAVILAWHLYVTWGNVPSFVLPGPGPVLAKIVEIAKNGSLWRHAGMTFYEIVVGFAFGTALGALVGYVLAHWRTLENLLQPYILFAQTAPKIALIPLFVIWFGLGMTSKIVLIVSNVFFPVMINTMLGLRSVPAELNELMTLLKASRW
ncbi:MAG: ABC transporter permease subunit, partial [Bacillota bacterium]